MCNSMDINNIKTVHITCSASQIVSYFLLHLPSIYLRGHLKLSFSKEASQYFRSGYY